jgi:hypothetical protein
MHVIVLLNCLMVGKKLAKEYERYTGQSVRYHAMQPQHCFRKEGGTGWNVMALVGMVQSS